MFFYVLIILAIILIILISLKYEIKIKNLTISTEKEKGRILNKNYKITILIYILEKIPILKLELTKDKLDKINVKDKIKNINITNIKTNNIDKETLKKIKKLKPRIKYINLFANIGTEDAALTSYIVAIVSTGIGILLNDKLKDNKNKFIINPLYINKNLLNLELNTAVEIKMIHIIYIIYILNKDKKIKTKNKIGKSVSIDNLSLY